ncbi:MAG: VWA domain-containing protein [Bryobacteraceae bacterium]
MKAICALVLALSISGLEARQNQPAPQPGLVLHGGTQEVLLDFVVRDKHQKLVKDLRPEDIQIFEDGVPQKLRSFAFRDGRTSPNAPSSRAGRSNDALRQINLVTLVFEGMSPLSRRAAVERAHDFLKAETGPNTWMAVYSLRYQLSVQQPYTTDLALLQKAVDHAGTGAYQQFAKENLKIVEQMNSLQAYRFAAQVFQPVASGSAEDRGPQNDAALAIAEVGTQRPDGTVGAAVEQLLLKTLFRQEGTRSIDALRTLIREQARQPGRKTILLFTEGLVIPPGQPELLDSVIAEANRANVSFYTVDTRGLTTVSNLRLSQATSVAIDDAEQGNGPGFRPVPGGPAVYQTDLQANARHLAEGTGGFSMDNSNDLRRPLERVMEDVRSHYEATYAPSAENFDGHFRKLEVKLAVAGLRVQSRAGYYALPLVDGATIAPYEMAALKAMNLAPAPHAFPYTAATLRFGTDPGGVNCRIVFAVPGSSLQFENDSATRSFRIHLSVLGLVKDDRGQIVAKVADDLPFRGPAEKQASFAQGKVTLTLPVHLPPGRYQLQTAVIDREADLASVKKSVLMVPGSSVTGPGVSDIVWVRSVKPGETPDPGNPLNSPQGGITPELEPMLARTDPAIFYFVAYPGGNALDKPEARIAVARDGKVLTANRLTAPELDENGAYPYSATLPIMALEPGQYELIVTVKQGAGQTAREALFEVR